MGICFFMFNLEFGFQLEIFVTRSALDVTHMGIQKYQLLETTKVNQFNL